MPPAGVIDSSGGAAVSVPGYEVLQELGRDGMGVVWKVKQDEDDHPMAWDLDSGNEVPARPDEQIVSDICPGRNLLARVDGRLVRVVEKPDEEELSFRRSRARVSVGWHLAEGRANAVRGRAFAAWLHYDRVRRESLTSPELLRDRARLAWRLEQREAALADLSRPELRGGASWTIHSHAVACLACGNRAGYRQACRALLEQSDREGQLVPTIAFALAPDGNAEVKELLARARLKKDPIWPDPSSHAALLWRAGRPREALPLLQRAWKAKWLMGGAERCQVGLLLALVCRSLGDEKQSAQALAQADDYLLGPRRQMQSALLFGATSAGPLAVLTTAAGEAAMGDPWAARHEPEVWLELELLRREAVQGGEETKQPKRR
jgi:hypothetical protein